MSGAARRRMGPGGPLLAIAALAVLAACGPPARPNLSHLAASADRTAGTVAVRKGETVYAVARRTGLPMRAIIEANDLPAPYRLAVGQRLVLPVARVHVVRKGDTVYGISRRYDVDMTTLVRLNRIRAPYRISPGQRLNLPVARRPQQAALPAAGSAAKAATRSRRAITIPRPPPRAGSKFHWPVRGRVISRFGAKKGGLHNDGINIAAPRGAKVRAAENGVVGYAGNELRGFGNLLIVKHAGGWTTAYAHNDALLAKRGDKVKRGQVIARVGSTGAVARPQLHFEIRRGRRAVNPLRHLGRRQTAAVTPRR